MKTQKERDDAKFLAKLIRQNKEYERWHDKHDESDDDNPNDCQYCCGSGYYRGSVCQYCD